MRIALKLLLSTFLLASVYSCGPTAEGGMTINDLGSNSSGPTISISFTTSSANGAYAPKHVKAVWVSDSKGTLVKTLGRWAGQYVTALKWRYLTGVDVDVKTGATESSHGDVQVNNWDITDKSGSALPNGEYQLNIEFNENDDPSRHQSSSSIFVLKSDTAYLTQKDENGKIFNINVIYNK